MSPELSVSAPVLPSLRLSAPQWPFAVPDRGMPGSGLITGLRARIARGGAGLASALVVGTLFSALAFIEAGPMEARHPHALVVAVQLTPPASPPPASPPPPQAAPQPAHAAIVAPALTHPPVPVVQAVPQPLAAPAQVAPAVSAPPAPPAPAAAAPVSAAPAPPAGPVEAGDLSARLVSFTPPAYPTESRRQREEGTVVLSLLLDTDGRVAEIAVAKSSGSSRLDRAALDAARRWRWAPLVVHGAPAMVRGLLRIPFVLKG